MDNVVSFSQWISGEVKTVGETFEPILGNLSSIECSVDGIVENREILGYRGKQTGKIFGIWLEKVLRI